MPRISDNARETALEVITTLEVVERIRPPDDLTDEQREEFMRVVGVCPADWFSSANIELLCAYSRHVVAARRVAELIERAMQEGRGEGLGELLKAQARESRALCQCMTLLRLTPRSVSPRSVSVKRL